MPYSFRPAALSGVGVWAAIQGGSRCGKTLTALRLARGIAGPTGKIAAADTEGRRMSAFAQRPELPEQHGEDGKWRYHFDVYDMRSPYDPDRFCDIVAAAEAAGYAAMIIDSFSLEWSGIGGVLHRYDVEFARLGGDQKNSNTAWRVAKKPHRAMRDRLLQSAMPIIFCIRANEVAEHLAGGRKGTWKSEQDARFIYEWTFSLTMHSETPGIVRYDLKTPTGADAWKMPPDLRGLFPDGKIITEAAGEGVQAWRNSHATAVASEPEGPSDEQISVFLADCALQAQNGTAHYKAWWPSQDPSLRRRVTKDDRARFGDAAREADARVAEEAGAP